MLCIVQGVRLVKGHRHRFLVRSSVQHIVDDGLGSSRLGYSPGRQACEGQQAQIPSSIGFGNLEQVKGHMLNQLAHEKRKSVSMSRPLRSQYRAVRCHPCPVQAEHALDRTAEQGLAPASATDYLKPVVLATPLGGHLHKENPPSWPTLATGSRNPVYVAETQQVGGPC